MSLLLCILFTGFCIVTYLLTNSANMIQLFSTIAIVLEFFQPVQLKNNLL